MDTKKLKKWSLPTLFMVTILINYVSAMGFLFPNTQAEVSDKYINLLAPAGFTFSIWSVIYFGVLLIFLARFLFAGDSNFRNFYQKYITPLSISWMTLNIIWTISWSYERLFLSFIVLFLYMLVLLFFVRVIHQKDFLKDKKWVLTYPVGLHAGWLIVAIFANFTTLIVQRGFDGTGIGSIIWTLVALILVLSIAITAYYTTKNDAIMLPALWALIGIIVKHYPNSAFQYSSFIVFFGAILLFLMGSAILVKLFYK